MHLAKTEMKQLIERLRELEAMYPTTSDRVGMGALVETWEAMPQLLDRLDRLEAQIGKFQEESLYYMSQNAKMQAVAEAAESYLGMWVEKDDPRDRDLRDALAAVEEKE